MHLPLSLYAGRRNLLRLFQGAGTTQSAAYRCEVICPNERVEIRPPVFLEGQLEKITAAVNKTVESAIIETTRREVEHAATLAYHVRDAVLIDGSVYSGRWKYPLSRALNTGEGSTPVHVQTAALASTPLGTRHFGHWLKDDCIQYLLAERYNSVLSVRRPPSIHEAQYAKYFVQNWAPTDCAHVDNLIVFQDFAQNSLKSKRYEILTSRIKASLGAFQSPELVYLKRGRTGVSRLIENEDEIVQALEKKGFAIIDVELDSLERLITSLMNSRVVVSIEGSQIAHCWFSPTSKSGLITLQPPDRFTAIHRGWIESVSARFGFVVGDRGIHGSLFSPLDILRTVDMMLAEL